MADETPRRRLEDRSPAYAITSRLAPFILAFSYMIGAFVLTAYVVRRFDISGEAAAALAGMVIGLVFGKLDLILPSIFPNTEKRESSP